MVILPWQSGPNAEVFGQTMQQQGKKVTMFGTDGTDRRSVHRFRAATCPTSGRTSRPKSALDKAIVKGVAKFGPYGPFGVPTYEATDVVMRAIASVCKAGKKPSRANVLAAVRKTNIPAAQNPLGDPDRVQGGRRSQERRVYLFKINAKGAYIGDSRPSSRRLMAQ